MYVCMCKGVTDRHIKAAVENGADNFEQLQQELAVSSQCGCCENMAREVLDEALQARHAATPFYAAA